MAIRKIRLYRDVCRKEKWLGRRQIYDEHLHAGDGSRDAQVSVQTANGANHE